MSATEAASEQTDRPASGGHTFVIVLAILIALLLPILYCLSIGPAVLLISAGYISEGTAQVFYTPLIWLHEHTSFAPILEWYVEFWVSWSE